MTDGGLTAKVFRTWDDLSALRPAWDELLADSSAPSVFLTHEWLESWWIAYRESRELFVIGFFDAAGALVGVAPLYRTSRREHTRMKVPVRMFRFIGTGTGGTSTSLGVLARRGSEAAITRRFLDWLSASRSQWDVLDLHLMEAEPVPTQAMMGELARRKWHQVRKEDAHLSVPLPDKYETYLASLSKKMRTELPYESRRLHKKYQVGFRKVRTDAELSPAIDALFQINAKRWQARGQAGSFGDVEKRVLCQEVAKRFLARGWLDFWLLELDGRVGAVEFGFRHAGTYYPLWVAIDTEFQAYSPGATLRTHIIEELIGEGIRVYEFMQGDESYKIRWGTETRAYVSVLCAPSRSYGSLAMRASAWSLAAAERFVRLRRKGRNRLRSVLSGALIRDLRSRLKRPRKAGSSQDG